LEYWYEYRHKKLLSEMDQSRIQQDVPVLREIISIVGDDPDNPTSAGYLFSFVFSDPGDGDKWVGWDKKTPDLQNLLKHVRKGHLLQQFFSAAETPSPTSPLCDAGDEDNKLVRVIDVDEL
jgi:hypothetical protein